MVTAPSVWRMIGEARALPHRMRFDAIRTLASSYDGGGRPVIVIPGFMVHDVISVRLRRTLCAAGYDARGWGMGLNRGLRPETLGGLLDLLDDVHARSGMPVALVGWSLGGLFAREIAKLRPESVDRVITLASPFSGDPRANNVWRAYERIAGHPVDRPPIDVRIAEKPPVPTFAIWTRADGLVSPECTCGLPGERDMAVEVKCHHLSMVSAPAPIAAVLDLLALPLDKADLGV
jgi:hypothetical protein